MSDDIKYLLKNDEIQAKKEPLHEADAAVRRESDIEVDTGNRVFQQVLNIHGIELKPAKIFADARGEFSCRPISSVWIQENISISHKGVFRGMHLQIGKNSQTKNVRVIKGSIVDFVIDLRPRSGTFLNIYQVTLTGKDKTEIQIPGGCGHGFLSLENNTIMQYLVDKPYDPEHEVSIRPDMIPEINKALTEILPPENLVFSQKDQEGISLDEFIKSYSRTL